MDSFLRNVLLFTCWTCSSTRKQTKMQRPLTNGNDGAFPHSQSWGSQLGQQGLSDVAVEGHQQTWKHNSHVHGLPHQQSVWPTDCVEQAEETSIPITHRFPFCFLILFNSVLLSTVTLVSTFKTETSRPCSLSQIAQANICYQTALYQISKHQLLLPDLVQTKSVSKHHLSDCFVPNQSANITCQIALYQIS